mgnify:CR=1 FL=1
MRQPFPISLVRIFRLESQSSHMVKQFIHSTADTQYNDSDKADKQTCTGQSRCAEALQVIMGLVMVVVIPLFFPFVKA